MKNKLELLSELKRTVHLLEKEIIQEEGMEAAKNDRNRRISDILEKVAGAFNLSPSDLKEKNKTPRMVMARMLVAYTSRMEGHSWKSIGKTLKRDHSTIIYYDRQGFDLRRRQFPEFEKNIQKALTNLDFVTPEQDTAGIPADVLTGQTALQ